ncbi:hypothetical protein Csa_004068 [Cucumis sativus]|uniref:Uncharacterized protein n=1 Tax=Cucumis sativus TaxID=3659 RepID=A0A0A0KFT4_CUCSA|nr:hypothetical protein Csa_004068 [Cucumis sativus]
MAWAAQKQVKQTKADGKVDTRRSKYATKLFGKPHFSSSILQFNLTISSSSSSF